MKAHRYSWIALLTTGAALAVEPPAKDKPLHPDSPADGMVEKAGKKSGGAAKGERGGKDGRRGFMEIWKKADTDGDGFISEAEFAAMERPGRLPEEKRAEIFKRIDKNGDGKIGPGEMPKGRPRGMPPLEQADVNKDGKIDFEEFKKWGFVQRLPEERQKAIFTRMDRDGDGVLTPKDRPQREGRRDGKKGPDGKGPHGPNPLDLVKDHDTDGDGALSFGEFREIPWIKDKGEDEQEDRFEKMDKNGDLKLDPSDFPPPQDKPRKAKNKPDQ